MDNQNNRQGSEQSPEVFPQSIKNEFLKSVGSHRPAQASSDDAEPKKKEPIDKPADISDSSSEKEKNEPPEQKKNEPPQTGKFKLFDRQETENDKKSEIKKEKEPKKEPKKKPEKQRKPKPKKENQVKVKEIKSYSADELKQAAKKIKPIYSAVFLAMLVPSVIVLVLPFAIKSDNLAIQYSLAAIFWIGLMFAWIAMLILKTVYRNVLFSMLEHEGETYKTYRCISLINFFRNKIAKIADVCFFVFAAVIIIFVILSAKNISVNLHVTAAAFAGFLLSLNYHMYFNNIIYDFLENTK